MNRLWALIFLVFYIGGIFRTGSLWMSYYANQDAITELFCINKDRPELKCNGKCHVISQVEESKGNEQLPNVLNEVSFNLEYFEILSPIILPPHTSTTQYICEGEPEPIEGFDHPILKPPRKLA